MSDHTSAAARRCCSLQSLRSCGARTCTLSYRFIDCNIANRNQMIGFAFDAKPICFAVSGRGTGSVGGSRSLGFRLQISFTSSFQQGGPKNSLTSHTLIMQQHGRDDIRPSRHWAAYYRCVLVHCQLSGADMKHQIKSVPYRLGFYRSFMVNTVLWSVENCRLRTRFARDRRRTPQAGFALNSLLWLYATLLGPKAIPFGRR